MNVVTEVVWEVLKPQEKILFVVPFINYYETLQDTTSFQSTLQSIKKNKNAYIVMHIEHFDYSEDTLRLYERFYDIELQWIPNLSVLQDPSFLEHHSPKKLYVLSNDQFYEPSYFTCMIVDSHTFTHEYGIPRIDGKGLLEEKVISRFYLNKFINQFSTNNTVFNLSSSKQVYDVGFFIGDLPDNYPKSVLNYVISDYVKANRCSCLYVTDSDLRRECKIYAKRYFPVLLLKQSKAPSILQTLSKIALRYTTVVFIGRFPNLLQDKPWQEKREKNVNDMLFDPFAHESLAGTSAAKKCLFPLELLRLHLN